MPSVENNDLKKSQIYNTIARTNLINLTSTTKVHAMNTSTTARYVSVLSIAAMLTELVNKGMLRQIPYDPSWAGATDYFDKMFKHDVKVDVKPNELVVAWDDRQRWILIGAYEGDLNIAFQRYTATPEELETKIVYQHGHRSTSLSVEMNRSSCDLLSFDGLLEFIGHHDNTDEIVNVMEQALTMTIPNVNLSAGSTDSALDHSAAKSNPATNKENEVMSTDNNNTAAAAAQNAADAAAANAQGAQTAASAAAAAPAAAPAAPVSDAGKTRAANGKGEVTSISTAQKAGWFAGGVAVGAAATAGGIFAWNKWFRD